MAKALSPVAFAPVEIASAPSPLLLAEAPKAKAPPPVADAFTPIATACALFDVLLGPIAIEIDVAAVAPVFTRVPPSVLPIATAA